MSLALTIMVVLAIVVFLYNLLVMAQGPEYPTPTYPHRISYPEQGEVPGDWPVLEEGPVDSDEKLLRRVSTLAASDMSNEQFEHVLSAASGILRRVHPER